MGDPKMPDIFEGISPIFAGVKGYQRYLLALASGCLLALSWFPNGTFALIFVAFIPMLILEESVCNDATVRSRRLILPFYLCFLSWNVITTWWLWNASAGGGVMAWVLNALIMTAFFYTAHRIKRNVGKWGNFILITSWLAFEYIHLNWELSWSWLTLGNVFADAPGLIQWYEYTGVLGGSLWILIANFVVLKVLRDKREGFTGLKKIILAGCVILLPMGISLVVNPVKFSKGNGKDLNVVILQPNVDPYNEKFFLGFEEQLEKMLELAKTKIDSTTDYLVFPETALTESIWEEALGKSESLARLKTFLKSYPKLKLIVGANTSKAFQPGEPLSETARKFYNADAYYDAFNTAIQIDNTDAIQLYHKSRLVPGVERVPMQFIFKYLEDFAMDMGGTVGSLGMQKERSLLYSPDSVVKVAPVICYESIFGDYVTEYVRKGANVIAIITNDGWWGDSPGYKQHLRYGRLRAIENRRWIIRSANTGVSCFIDPDGDISQATGYWVPAVISGGVNLSDEQTFYTRFGDYIGRIALYTAMILLIYSLFIRFGLVKKS